MTSGCEAIASCLRLSPSANALFSKPNPGLTPGPSLLRAKFTGEKDRQCSTPRK